MRCDAMGWVRQRTDHGSFVRPMGPLAVIAPYASQPWWAWGTLRLRARRLWHVGIQKSGQLFGGDVVLIAPNRIGGMASAKWPTRRLRPYPVREKAQPAACPRRRRLRARRQGQRNGRDGKLNSERARPSPTNPRPERQPHGKLSRRTHAGDGDRPEPPRPAGNGTAWRLVSCFAAACGFACARIAARGSTPRARSLGFHPTQEARPRAARWWIRGRSRSWCRVSGRCAWPGLVALRCGLAICTRWPGASRAGETGRGRQGLDGMEGSARFALIKERAEIIIAAGRVWGPRIFSSPSHQGYGIRRSIVGRRGREG